MSISNFDFSIIYKRHDGSYVINHGLYHVPNEGEWADLWAQIDAYTKKHPEVVKPEPGEPEPTLEEERTAALSRIDSATSAAILAGFEYEVETGEGKEILHFSYLADDQQNFSDTANGALLAMQGVESVPNSVKWNGWRNHTPEYKGDLVRLVLDVPSFLMLYTQGALVHKAVQMEVGGQRKVAIEAAKSVEEIEALMQEWGI